MEPPVSPLAPSTSFTTTKTTATAKISNGNTTSNKNTEEQLTTRPKSAGQNLLKDSQTQKRQHVENENPLHDKERQQQHSKHHRVHHARERDQIAAREQKRRRNRTGFGRSSRRMGFWERRGGRRRDQSHLPWRSSQERGRREGGRERMRRRPCKAREGSTLYPAPPAPRFPPRLVCFVGWIGSACSARGRARAQARLGVAHAARPAKITPRAR